MRLPCAYNALCWHGPTPKALLAQLARRLGGGAPELCEPRFDAQMHTHPRRRRLLPHQPLPVVPEDRSVFQGGECDGEGGGSRGGGVGVGGGGGGGGEGGGAGSGGGYGYGALQLCSREGDAWWATGLQPVSTSAVTQPWTQPRVTMAEPDPVPYSTVCVPPPALGLPPLLLSPSVCAPTIAEAEQRVALAALWALQAWGEAALYATPLPPGLPSVQAGAPAAPLGCTPAGAAGATAVGAAAVEGQAEGAGCSREARVCALGGPVVSFGWELRRGGGDAHSRDAHSGDGQCGAGDASSAAIAGAATLQLGLGALPAAAERCLAGLLPGERATLEALLPPTACDTARACAIEGGGGTGAACSGGSSWRCRLLRQTDTVEPPPQQQPLLHLFTPSMGEQRRRLAVVVLQAAGASSLCDLGCGEGALLRGAPPLVCRLSPNPA